MQTTRRAMTINRNVNKPVCALIGIIVITIAFVMAYVSVSDKLEWADKSEAYEEAEGYVTYVDKQTYTYRSDGKTRRETKYAARVDYIIDKVYYSITTDYDMKSTVKVGDRYVVMYKSENPKMAYIAIKDSLTDAYIPYNVETSSMWMVLFILIGVGIIPLGLCFDNTKVVMLSIGLGFSLIGFGGGITGMMEGMYACAVLLLFGVIGIFVIYKAIFTNEKTIMVNEAGKVVDEQGEYKTVIVQKPAPEYRLFIVRDVVPIMNTGIYTIVFERPEQNGMGTFFSFDTPLVAKYTIGAKFQLDNNLIDSGTVNRVVKGGNTWNISYIGDEDFKELSGALKFMLNGIN